MKGQYTIQFNPTSAPRSVYICMYMYMNTVIVKKKVTIAENKTNITGDRRCYRPYELYFNYNLELDGQKRCSLEDEKRGLRSDF